MKKYIGTYKVKLNSGDTTNAQLWIVQGKQVWYIDNHWYPLNTAIRMD